MKMMMVMMMMMVMVMMMMMTTIRKMKTNAWKERMGKKGEEEKPI
jgi:hypothetical protein